MSSPVLSCPVTLRVSLWQASALAQAADALAARDAAVEQLHMHKVAADGGHARRKADEEYKAALRKASELAGGTATATATAVALGGTAVPPAVAAAATAAMPLRAQAESIAASVLGRPQQPSGELSYSYYDDDDSR